MEFDPRQWVSAATAAQLANVSVSWVRKLADQEQIRVLDTDLGRLYFKPDVLGITRQRRSRRGQDHSQA